MDTAKAMISFCVVVAVTFVFTNGENCSQMSIEYHGTASACNEGGILIIEYYQFIEWSYFCLTVTDGLDWNWGGFSFVAVFAKWS